MNTVSVKKDYQSLKIYIEGLLHLELRMDNHDGIQSWLEGSCKSKIYKIEFYRKESDPIVTEYDDIKIWKDILVLIDENI